MRIKIWQIVLFVLIAGSIISLGTKRSGRSNFVARLANHDSAQIETPHPAGAKRPTESVQSVILISIDTLRADHMSLYGYHRPTTPNIDRFAAKCRVFERAYATSPFTSPSIVSMLSGLYPQRHGVRLLWQRVDADLVLLSDRMRSAGFQTAAVISNIVLSNKATGLGDRFDYYDESMQATIKQRPQMLERGAAKTTDSALSWLAEHRDPVQPFFLWVHYIDPHGPYTPPDDKPINFSHSSPQIVDSKMIPKSVYEPDLLDGLEYVDRYDEEVAYADAQIGRLLERMEQMGLLQDSLVVITADHGEHLMDGNGTYFSHGFDVRDATVRVPLLVCGAGVPAQREPQPVSVCDVMPTVLAASGLEIPKGIDGRSLLGEISRRPPYVEGPDSAGSGGLHRAFVYADRKVIVQHGRSNIPRRAWAFDLAADPLELNPLTVDESEPAYWVLAQMILDDPHPGGIPESRRGSGCLVAEGADHESTDALRALGYIK